MHGTRGKALAGWVSVAVLVLPITAAHASVLPPPATPRSVAPPPSPVSQAVFATDCPSADVMPTSATRTATRIATTCLINHVREAAGLRPLASMRVLRRIAARHSRDMVVRRYFSHTGPFHNTLTVRLRSIGWEGSAGENIGFGTAYSSTPRAMVWAWMRSSGHRANILEPQYRFIGAAIALGAPTGVTGPAATYTTDFGGPSQ
jgi:uncharacterized protein YkwD